MENESIIYSEIIEGFIIFIRLSLGQDLDHFNSTIIAPRLGQRFKNIRVIK